MQIKKFKPVDHFVRATVYGGSGVGKTVFGGTAPKPIFASAENGLLSIVSTLGYSPDYVTINSINDMQELYKFLKAGNHGYETLVIDSMTEMNEIIKDGIEKRIGKAMEIQDWGELARKLKGIIRSMQDLPIHIILICQEKIETDKKGNVLNVKPMLNGKTSDEVAYLMDIVAYMYINSKGERVITTTPNEKLVSKDRTGLLQTDVSLNFNDRVVAMQKLQTGKSAVVHNVVKEEPKQEKPTTPTEHKPVEPTAPVQETPVEPVKPQETAPIEQAPVATAATEKPISHSDKMIAMTAYSGYCEKANPGFDKKLMFAAMVADKFNGKIIDDLTESEGKQLIAIIQETIDAFKEQAVTEAPIVEQPVEPTEAEKVDQIVNDLPF